MGTRIVLKDRICKDGYISLEFYPYSSGIVSILFRFQNKDTYYKISFKPTGVEMHRKYAKTFMEINKDPSFTLKKKLWHKVILDVKPDNCTIFAKREDT